MGTIVKINYYFSNNADVGRFKLPFDNFYFVEEPFVVLQKIISRFNVISYKKLISKNLHLSSANVGSINLRKKYSLDEVDSFYEPRKLIKLNYGLDILEVDNSHIDNLVAKSVKNFSIPFLKNIQKPYYFKKPESFLCGFIQNYFIDIKTEKKDDFIVVSKINNYLDDRLETMTADGEFELNTILEIGSALYKKSINVDFLKSLQCDIPKIGNEYTF